MSHQPPPLAAPRVGCIRFPGLTLAKASDVHRNLTCLTVALLQLRGSAERRAARVSSA